MKPLEHRLPAHGSSWSNPLLDHITPQSQGPIPAVINISTLPHIIASLTFFYSPCLRLAPSLPAPGFQQDTMQRHTFSNETSRRIEGEMSGEGGTKYVLPFLASQWETRMTLAWRTRCLLHLRKYKIDSCTLCLNKQDGERSDGAPVPTLDRICHPTYDWAVVTTCQNFHFLTQTLTITLLEWIFQT